MATMTGMKIVLMRKWDVEEGMNNVCGIVTVIISIVLASRCFVGFANFADCVLMILTRLIRTENVSIAGGYVFKLLYVFWKSYEQRALDGNGPYDKQSIWTPPRNTPVRRSSSTWNPRPESEGGVSKCRFVSAFIRFS